MYRSDIISHCHFSFSLVLFAVLLEECDCAVAVESVWMLYFECALDQLHSKFFFCYSLFKSVLPCELSGDRLYSNLVLSVLHGRYISSLDKIASFLSVVLLIRIVSDVLYRYRSP